MQPAIRLAAGFPASAGLARSIQEHAALLTRDQESSGIYFPGGLAPAAGQTFAQPDLQRSLEALASSGRQAFYEGPVGDALLQAMKERGGLFVREDLLRYRPEAGPPMRIHYRGVEILGPLPPAGAGEVLQALKILEGFDLGGLAEADRLHVVASALRIAFADRTAYKGDPAFTRYPWSALLSDGYTERRRREIALDRVPAVVAPGTPRDLGLERLLPPRLEAVAASGGSTSHLVTADREENMVSLTQTLGDEWGSGVTVPGTGILLNNGMRNFSIRPDSPRRLVGGTVRSSSMAPMMVLQDGRCCWSGPPGAPGSPPRWSRSSSTSWTWG